MRWSRITRPMSIKAYHDGRALQNLTQFRDFEIGDGQVMRTTGFAKTVDRRSV